MLEFSLVLLKREHYYVSLFFYVGSCCHKLRKSHLCQLLCLRLIVLTYVATDFDYTSD
jgi:hypothetical protein